MIYLNALILASAAVASGLLLRSCGYSVGRAIYIGISLVWLVLFFSYIVAVPLVGANPAIARVTLIAFIVICGCALYKAGVERLSRAETVESLMWLLGASVSVLIMWNGPWAVRIQYLTFSNMLSIPGLEFPLHSSYGAEYLLPFIYQKYALEFATSYLSSEDPERYLLTTGRLLASITPFLVSIGTYYAFRALKFGWIKASIATVMFWVLCLGNRFLMPVAENFAWVTGFAFLILVADALSQRNSRPSTWALIAALLYLTASIHGVTAFVAAIFAGGIWLREFIVWPANARVRIALVSMGSALALALLLAVGQAYLHGFGTSDRVSAIANTVRPSPAPGGVNHARNYREVVGGGQDASVLEDIKRLSQPPYFGYPKLLRMAVSQTGQKFWVVEKLGIHPGIFVLATTIFGLAWLVLWKRTLPSVVCGALVTFVVIVGLALYFDSISVSGYPVKSVVARLFRYLPVMFGLAVLSGVSAVTYSGPSRIERAKRQLAVAGLGTVLLYALISVISIEREGGHTNRAELFRIAKVIRTHTPEHGAVMLNRRTVNILSFLTRRNILSEGRSPYQMYGIMDEIVGKLLSNRAFFENPSQDFLDRNNVGLVIVADERQSGRDRFGGSREALEQSGLFRQVYQEDNLAAYVPRSRDGS